MLRDRRFRVHMGNDTSAWRSQRNGFPQGSVLAPVLFNLYSNDRPVTRGRKIVYADMSRHSRPILQRIGMQSLVRYGADVTLLSTVATSRKPLWLDLQPVDIKSRRRHNWKSAQVVNSHLVCDPTIRQPGFDLPRQHWSLLNHFHMDQGHCGACRRKWRLTDTDMCPCGENQTMSHIVESCPLTKLNGG